MDKIELGLVGIIGLIIGVGLMQVFVVSDLESDLFQSNTELNTIKNNFAETKAELEDTQATVKTQSDELTAKQENQKWLEEKLESEKETSKELWEEYAFCFNAVYCFENEGECDVGVWAGYWDWCKNGTDRYNEYFDQFDEEE